MPPERPPSLGSHDSTHPSSLPSNLLNPTSLQLCYTTALFLHTFDTYLFLTISPLIFPSSSPLPPQTTFWIRASALQLLAITTLIYSLRHHNIKRTYIGRCAALSFVFLEASTLFLVVWTNGGFGFGWGGEEWIERGIGGDKWVERGYFRFEPFWGVICFHAGWVAWVVVGFWGQ